MGHAANSLRHLGMIATSPSWRRYWYDSDSIPTENAVLSYWQALAMLKGSILITYCAIR